jgi:hypothetical protein
MLETMETQLEKLQRKPDTKQTEKTIFDNCKKKYIEGKKILETLELKKKKLEDEISHLQQKQADRKKFLDETAQRHKKN